MKNGYEENVNSGIKKEERKMEKRKKIRKIENR